MLLFLVEWCTQDYVTKSYNFKNNVYIATIMKNVLILMMAFLSLQGWAQEKKNKNASYTFEVNGNCETCKQRIEKAAYAVKGVKSAVWDIETHQLQLIINEEKTNLDAVKKAIASIGHDVIGSYKAPDAVYENLHHCCKYERVN